MIDWSRIAQLRDEIGNEDFAELVPVFLDEVSEAVQALGAAGPAPADLARQLHHLRGCALNFGFATLADMCSEGERLAMQGRPDAVDLDAIAATFGYSRTQFLNGLDRQIPA